MTVPTVAHDGPFAQPFIGSVPSEPNIFELPPDAIRLMGHSVPSGLSIGCRASYYAGDGWRSGLVVATGETSATIETTRYGTTVVHDWRNLLIGADASRHRRALVKWMRDHGRRP